MAASPLGRVGWIGLGAMGLPMAARIAQAGYQVTGWDLDPERIRLAGAHGLATISIATAADPADVARRSDIIGLCLPHGDAVTSAIFGDDGCVHGGMSGKLVIDTTTVDPVQTQALATRLAEMGGAWIDAPVSGGVRSAEDGTLAAFLGGADADVARALPIVAAFAERPIHLGASGTGQWVKLLNQAIVCGTIALWAEALELAHAAELDPHMVVEALAGGGADSRVRAAFGPALAAGHFTPSANLTKDSRLVLDRMQDAGADTALFEAVSARLLAVKGRRAPAAGS